MIQKTYHIKDYTPGKLRDILTEVAGMKAYRDAAQVLLVMFEQNWDTDVIGMKTAMIRDMLPKAEIAGTTHYDGPVGSGLNGAIVEGDVYPEYVSNNSILSFIFFERRSFVIGSFGLEGLSDEEAGLRLKSSISAVTDPKCMMTFFACPPRDISYLLDVASRDHHDLPILGATSGQETLFETGKDSSYVFDNDGIYSNRLLSVCFFGAGLRIKTTYNFGWRQVGRTMIVTALDDPYTVTEIDGHPAADIYGKYLGIPRHGQSLSIANTCEFPFVTRRQPGESCDRASVMQMGRIPFNWTDEGALRFAVTMHEGEELRLSYGLPQNILSQVYDDVKSFCSFAPQAMLLVVCMNRMFFLREQEHLEVDAYRSVAPEVAFIHGNSEIYRNLGSGGEMHSALIALGMSEEYEGESGVDGAGSDRSGSRSPEAECCAANAECGSTIEEFRSILSGDGLASNEPIPLEYRLMSFLRAVTSDLEQTTDELTVLKNDLENEVERKTRENESLELHVVQTLAEAIDAKDTYTNGHSSRVAKYSREIARRAGYSEKAMNEIYIMGLLHDVGKIGVPDAVINKPGRLTDEEFAQIREHPVMGARILSNIKEMPKLVTGARWHHERIDGRGYPDGLAGTDIPEEARIIAVADAYDAMTSNRSYRRGMEQSAVREQFEKGRGTQFDPRFADIMLAMIDADTDYEMREK